jgi:hypothetical protein
VATSNRFEQGFLHTGDSNANGRQPGQSFRDEYLSSLSSPGQSRVPQPASGSLEIPPAFRPASGTLEVPPAFPAASGKQDVSPSTRAATGTHTLEISPAFQPARPTQIEQATAAGGVDLTRGHPPLAQSQWTLVFDLTTTQSHSSDDNGGGRVVDGAEHKRQELLKLAESSRGTGVTLVVQAPQLNDAVAENSSGSSPNSSKSSSEARGSGRGAVAHNLNTYLIHDGQIEDLGSHPSQGAEQDLEGLMRVAARLAPSERMALFAQAHGGGPHGLSGDMGNIPLAQISPAIARGLAGSGRDRLDLLDFDACSMGNTEVARAMASITSQVVASPEKESSGGAHNDAQNVAAIVRSIAANPQMDGSAAGNEIVRLANAGANGGEAAQNPEDREHPGTPTLSHFDLTNIDSFSSSVNSLGSELSAAMQNETNRQAIRQLIAQTPLSTSEGARLIGKPAAEERDLKLFAAGLIEAVRSGQLSDPEARVARAAQEVLNQRASLVQSYHGEHAGGYDRQGGISIFLPGQTELDVRHLADENNPLQELVNLEGERPGAKGGARDQILDRIDYALRHLTREGGQEFAPCWQAMEQARRQMSDTMSRKDFARSIEQFRNLASQAGRSADGRRFNEKYLGAARHEVDEMIANQHLPAGSGWQQFISGLRGSS